MDVESYLNKLEEQLLNTERVEYEKRIYAPETPGCYIAWQKDVIIYVGETNNLKRRMKLMGQTVTHTLRVNIGKEVFGQVEGHKKRYSPEIEQKLDEYFSKNIKLSTMPVKLGRTELEELIIKKYRPKYNRSKRVK